MRETIDYDALDFGSAQPTFTDMENIIVSIEPSDILGRYAKALVEEMERVNPLTYDKVQITVDEMIAYAKFLLDRRIKSIHHECNDWRLLKQLWIPTYIQYVLRMIGEVIDYENGYHIDPQFTEKVISLEEAVAISGRIRAFERDIHLVTDAMPRGRDGNPEVMKSAVIANYVRSMEKVSHVSFTYVSAFAGLKLQDEVAFQILYRKRYDDLSYIALSFDTTSSVF